MPRWNASTAYRGQFELMYYEAYQNKHDATGRERFWKADRDIDFWRNNFVISGKEQAWLICYKPSMNQQKCTLSSSTVVGRENRWKANRDIPLCDSNTKEIGWDGRKNSRRKKDIPSRVDLLSRHGRALDKLEVNEDTIIVGLSAGGTPASMIGETGKKVKRLFWSHGSKRILEDMNREKLPLEMSSTHRH